MDPLESKYAGMSPYHYSFNNPIVWNDLSGESPGDPPKGSDPNMDPDRWVQKPQTVDNNRAYSREVLEADQKLHAEVEIKKESKPKKKSIIQNLKQLIMIFRNIVRKK
ncbi:MAG: hypothetical protein KL787_09075 [Taibaiella sp.]|nr:hypothetical protein [Taibaiella sp.]